MDKRILLSTVNQIVQIILARCETDKEIEQVKDGIEKYLDLSKSISQA